MKQLIPQSKIDDAARKYDKRDRSNEPEGCTNEDYIGFKYGVQFALNEIKPLMVEFAEFYHAIAEIEKKYFNRNCNQLLEEFIKEKNK